MFGTLYDNDFRRVKYEFWIVPDAFGSDGPENVIARSGFCDEAIFALPGGECFAYACGDMSLSERLRLNFQLAQPLQQQAVSLLPSLKAAEAEKLIRRVQPFVLQLKAKGDGVYAQLL